MIFADMLSATILFAMPLLLVALGGMFSERSGVINIALEGIMVIGGLCSCLFLRFADTWAFSLTGDSIANMLAAAPELTVKELVAAGQAFYLGQSYPQLTVLAGIVIAGISGILFSMLLAFASIRLKADQTIGGTALNMLAPALAVIITWSIQGEAQTTVLIPKWVRISAESLNLAPMAESFFGRLVFKSLYLTTPITLLLLAFSIVFLYKTKTGMRLRACGEHPQAADSVGINVYRMRYLGVGISGFFGGIGGLAYTVAAGSGFASTVAGYGFLALAVMIFGNWKPLNILFASLFFAFFRILASYSNSIPFLPNALGYGAVALVLDVLLLAVMRGLVKAPALTDKLAKAIVGGSIAVWALCVAVVPYDFTVLFSGIKSNEYIYLMLPYLVTMIVLILTSQKSRAPKAEGIPYDKGSR